MAHKLRHAPRAERATGIPARRQKSHFVAGSARIAVLPAATAADLGGFVRGAAKPGARIITDGLKSYDGLADSFRHYSIVQDGGKNADAVLPIVHVLFSNVKTWLNGTFHGVSAKHLPRYAREWNYRLIASDVSPI
jgi:hypothetical protein